MYAPLCRLLCCLALCACAAASARAQTEQEPPPPLEDGMQARGAFLTTRPNTPEKKPDNPPPVKRPTPTPTAGTGRNNNRRDQQTAKNTTQPNKGMGVKGTQDATGGNVKYNLASISPTAIGIGYTIYTRDANGDAIRVDPDRVFHSGEALRISLEANTDGYLYVFHTENEGEPEMIFPDSRLQLGSNFVRAHVPYEVPSNVEADDRLRWFVFDATPAIEHLYIVVTREPLQDVPAGDALVKFCRDPNHSCPWNPPRALWAQLVRGQGREQVAVSKIKDVGRLQTKGERDATTRGLGLAADAPEPTVVRMNASSTTGLLVTTLALVHK